MLKCLCIIRDKKIYENNLQTEAKKHQGIRYFSGDIKNNYDHTQPTYEMSFFLT